MGVTLPVFLFVLPSQKPGAPNLTAWTRVQQLDVVGSALFVGALCSWIMSLSFAGALYPWNNGRIIGLFCCSGLLTLLFGFQQATASLTTEESRILPIHILRSWEMWILIIETGCSIGILFIIIFYIPLYFQFIRGESAIQSAVHLLPFLITAVFAMLVSGLLISSFGYYKLWFVAGSILALIISVVLYTLDIDTSHRKIIGYLIMGGVGIGLYAMNAAPVMSAIVAKSHAADASTVFGCVDTLSGAFSVGVANCIFINRASDGIQRVLPDTPRSAVQEAIAGVGASLTDGLSPPLKRAVLQATLDAINDVWMLTMITAALSLVLSIFLRNKKLTNLQD